MKMTEALLPAIIALSFFACAGKARIATASPGFALQEGGLLKAEEDLLEAAEHPSYKAISEEILKKSAAGSRSE